MDEYTVFPLGDSFVITKGSGDIRIRVSGVEGVPVTKTEVDEILTKGKHEFKFDHTHGKVRELTKQEKLTRDKQKEINLPEVPLADTIKPDNTKSK